MGVTASRIQAANWKIIRENILLQTLNIHVFTTSNRIGSAFSVFFSLPLPLLPALICMIIGLQLMPAYRTRIVLILPPKITLFSITIELNL